MVAEVWLHVGTPKSGTSTLQKTLNAHAAQLAGQGLAYLAPDGRANANELAIALNKGRADDIRRIAGALDRAIETRPEPRALISSEMLYGTPPETLYQSIPALAERPLKVLVYLRRQDRYIEASYQQKSKNGRFTGSIGAYIDKFQGSGSDYAAMLAPWEAQSGAEVLPRIFERARLTDGDIVADALGLMGLTAPAAAEEDDVNVSPGLHRVQLVQALAQAGLANPRRLQRALAARYPQDPADRAPILSPAERRAFLDAHAAGNERLRARYHPTLDTLFAVDDPDTGDQARGIPPFTDAQLREIARVLEIAAGQR